MNSIRALLALLFLTLNTAIWCVPLYTMGLLRWLIPIASVRAFLSGLMDIVMHGWVGGNRVMNAVLGLHNNELTMSVSKPLSTDKKYIVLCNHQSWSDIVILQNTLRGIVPPLKFFTKRELIWLPLLGVAFWLLGFPYVRRRGHDGETLAKTCEGFKQHPVCVLNFLEGTRFTEAKRVSKESKHTYLLPPKIGGLAYVLGELGEQIDQILDVTIAYPDGTPTFWEYLKGETGRVSVDIAAHPVPVKGQDRSLTDAELSDLKRWTEKLWETKDTQLANLLQARELA